MNYPYLIPGQQSQPELFTADVSGRLGYYDKSVNEIVQLQVDYSKLSVPPTISSYSFEITPGGEPQLRVTSPTVATNTLSFTVQGGIAGRTYAMAINTIGYSSGSVRSDWLTINVLDDYSVGNSGCCQIVNPLSLNNGATSPDGSLFINTAPRFFVSATPPDGAQVMDQWWDTITLNLFVFISDGTASYWSQVSG
jgi:hypothetical protein